MTDPKPTHASRSDLGQSQSQPGSEAAPAGELPASDLANLEASGPPKPKKLTEAEQMALYEKDLQENDWGHQPC